MKSILTLSLFLIFTLVNAQRNFWSVEWPTEIKSEFKLDSEIVLDTSTYDGKKFIISSINKSAEMGIPYVGYRRYLNQSIYLEPSFRFSKMDYYLTPSDYSNFATGSLKSQTFVPGIKVGWTYPKRDVTPFFNTGIEYSFSKFDISINSNGLNSNLYNEYFRNMKPILMWNVKAGIQLDWLILAASYGKSFNAFDPGGHISSYSEMVYAHIGMIVFRSQLINKSKLPKENDQFQVDRNERVLNSFAEAEIGELAPIFSLKLKKGGFHTSYSTIDGKQHRIDINDKDIVSIPIPFIWMALKKPVKNSKFIYRGFDFSMAYFIYKFKNVYSTADAGGIISPGNTNPAISWEKESIVFPGFYLEIGYPTIGIKSMITSHTQFSIQTILNHNFFITSHDEIFPRLSIYIPGIGVMASVKRNRWGIMGSVERSILPIHQESAFRALRIFKIGFCYEMVRA